MGTPLSSSLPIRSGAQGSDTVKVVMTFAVQYEPEDQERVVEDLRGIGVNVETTYTYLQESFELPPLHIHIDLDFLIDAAKHVLPFAAKPIAEDAWALTKRSIRAVWTKPHRGQYPSVSAEVKAANGSSRIGLPPFEPDHAPEWERRLDDGIQRMIDSDGGLSLFYIREFEVFGTTEDETALRQRRLERSHES
jgi:hypothetical protein